MGNPQKRKGDAAEREVLALLQPVFPEAKRTRPGRREDEGDILTDSLTVQVKNVKTARWEEWLQQCDEQLATSGKKHSLLVWRRAGSGRRKPRLLAIIELASLLEMMGEDQ